MTSLLALALICPTPVEGITDFFPLNVGDSWIYAEESDNFELRTIDTVGDTVEHKLVFWFAPKKGIVRREIKFSTTREPMPPVEEQ